MLRFYRKAMFGPLAAQTTSAGNIKDIKGFELLVLAIIAFFVLFLGIFPNAVLRLSEPAVADLLHQIKF